MNLSAAFIGEIATDDIASASYNWAPTDRQQFYVEAQNATQQQTALYSS